MTMVRLFVRHKVTDYAKWRKVYDDFDVTPRVSVSLRRRFTAPRVTRTT
jgi:hypothetical protein